jgi:hypothetical protein
VKGDTAKAKVDYRDFLALWKDPDPNDEDGNAGKPGGEIEIVWNNFGALEGENWLPNNPKRRLNNDSWI